MKTAYIIGIIVIIVFGFGLYKSCQESSKAAYWRGQYELIETRVNEERVELLKTIDSLEGDIAKSDKDILGLEQEVKSNKVDIEDKSAEINKLETAYKTLENDTERVDNLTKQVAQWKEKFLLSESIIASKDKIIFSLTKKYESQFAISDKYRRLYINECEMSQVLTKRLDVCNKELKGLKFSNTVKTGVALALAGIIIYGLVSK